MKKLIPMKDFVLKESEKMEATYEESFMMCENYANFIKQPLTLGMIVPCGVDGNVLEEPIFKPLNDREWDKWEKEAKAYHDAKDKILFEGFEINDTIQNIKTISNGKFNIGWYTDEKGWYGMNYTIEELVKKYEIELTPSAIKQIGL